jgi:hypothetical protein
MASDQQLPSSSLSSKEYIRNSLQCGLLSIPYIGASLERFLFGPALEKRWKRFEQTLTEIGLKLDDLHQTHGVETEEFVALLEHVGPSLGRSTAEAKRIWFRDLLLNAALTPPGDAQWEEARLAADLIQEIEAPGLEILGKLHIAGYSGREAVVIFADQPVLAFWPKNTPAPVNQYLLSFDVAVVEEWMRRLSNLRVLHCVHPIHRRTATGQTETMRGCDSVALTELGQLLVKWGLSADGS